MQRVIFFCIIFLSIATNVSALKINSTWEAPMIGTITVSSESKPLKKGYNYNYSVTNETVFNINFAAGTFGFLGTIKFGTSKSFTKFHRESPTTGSWRASLIAGGSKSVRCKGEAVVPVPEPSTLLLLGSGLVGLVGLGRKRLFKKA